MRRRRITVVALASWLGMIFPTTDSCFSGSCMSNRLRRDRAVGRLARIRRLRRNARARQQYAHGRALVRLAFDHRDAAGLAREAVDLAQAEPGAFADRLGGEERIER